MTRPLICQSRVAMATPSRPPGPFSQCPGGLDLDPGQQLIQVRPEDVVLGTGRCLRVVLTLDQVLTAVRWTGDDVGEEIWDQGGVSEL